MKFEMLIKYENGFLSLSIKRIFKDRSESIRSKTYFILEKDILTCLEGLISENISKAIKEWKADKLEV